MVLHPNSVVLSKQRESTTENSHLLTDCFHCVCKANVTPTVLVLAPSSWQGKVGVDSVRWKSSAVIRGLCLIGHLNAALSGSGAPTSTFF